MREFVFEIRYAPGSDELMDLFIGSPEASSKAFLCSMGDAKLWKLDRTVGSTAAVEAATSLLTDPSYDQLSVSDRSYDARQYTDVLEQEPGRSLVYNYFDELARCDSVPTITNRYLNGALLFEVTRREGTERWRILMEDDKKVGMLYDTLQGTLGGGLSFHFDHVGDSTGSVFTPFSSVTIQPEQYHVLEKAAEEGYYRTPRETTLDELATELECPRSTVSYRLRRAEAALVDEYLTNNS